MRRHARVSMARVISATWMEGLVPVNTTQRDLLSADHDHAGVGGAASNCCWIFDETASANPGLLRNAHHHDS